MAGHTLAKVIVLRHARETRIRSRCSEPAEVCEHECRNTIWCCVIVHRHTGRRGHGENIKPVPLLGRMLFLLVNVSVALAQGQLDSRQTRTRTPSAAGVTYSYSYADAEGSTNRVQIFFSKLTVQIAGLGVPTPQVVQEQMRVLHDSALQTPAGFAI